MREFSFPPWRDSKLAPGAEVSRVAHTQAKRHPLELVRRDAAPLARMDDHGVDNQRLDCFPSRAEPWSSADHKSSLPGTPVEYFLGG
jgi:hypothetical protein